MQLTINNVSMRFGARILFEDVNTTFISGRRYAITGPNGAGKSTLMKILTGEIDCEKGTIGRPKKMGVLRQDQFAFDSFRVIDTVIMGNAALWEALQEREILYAKDHSALTDKDGMRLGELEGIVGDEGGYTAETDAAILLDGLDIPEELHDRKMSELQGGQKVRVLLAQALFGNPDVLLLDEPTNNLDLDSVHWLQNHLRSYDGCLIVISHDRHFLNEICTHIADIDYQTVIVYTGGYDDMIAAKGQVRSKIEQENSERKKKIEQLQDFVARFGAGTRASQVQSRKKQIERLSLTDLKRSNIERPFIQFLVKKPSSKQTLTIDGLDKAWPEVTVCEGFRAVVTKGEKIAVIGKSGVGKTTLCKMLMGEVKPDAGKIEWGTGTSIGYLAQDHRADIPNGQTVTQFLHSFDQKANLQEIRGLLGRMLFKGEEGMKPTDALSGGEAVRLIFSKLMLTKDNVLVLDEPTNHLDLESIVALGDALEKYEGTAFVVTHDRDLVASFATRIFSFTENGLIDWQGTYDDYVERFGGDDGPEKSAKSSEQETTASA